MIGYPSYASQTQPPRLLARPFLPLLAVFLLGGCSVFESYPGVNEVAVSAYRAGDFKAAFLEFDARTGALGADEFVYLCETGMVAQTAGKWKRSIECWQSAVGVLRGFDDRPTVSGRSVTEGVLSFALNDKTIPYDGEGFERALLHGMLAWNYLLLGKHDDMMVEIRRGELVRQKEEARYDTEYPGMGRFCSWMSALGYELDGKWDEAELDYRRIVKRHPADRTAWSGLIHALSRQGEAGNAADAKKRAPKGLPKRATAEQGEVVVVFLCGQMPPKRQDETWFQVEDAMARVVVPVLRGRRTEADGLTLHIDGQERGRSRLLEDVYATAEASLEDRVVWTGSKSLARTIAKAHLVDEIAERVGDSAGDNEAAAEGLALVLGSVLMAATEQADLRSWLTLPERIEVLRIPVEPGAHELDLSLDGTGGSIRLGAYEFEAGDRLLVHARSLGSDLHAYATGIPTLASGGL